MEPVATEKVAPSWRDYIYTTIEQAGGDCARYRAYQIFMVITVAVSMLPLCIKGETTATILIDRVAAGIFTIDYFLRWTTAALSRPERGHKAYILYPFTAWAIIDLLAILPSLTALNSAFRLLKLLRMARSLRVFKVLRYSKSLQAIVRVLKEERKALTVVCELAVAYILVTAIIMFNAEADSFGDFFEAVYWATTALTTVGYGDIFPVTTAGRVVSMLSSLAGIAVVALPAGIITAGYMRVINSTKTMTERDEAAQ